ncbi:MAG TPA: translocation/assembly module TamB domain-containing protein [Thermoanaerobaculia bacterium]|nr:translocation/assembly module TamB domain-containing protein [Thermoanaerobaculia bacterium]
MNEPLEPAPAEAEPPRPPRRRHGRVRRWVVRPFIWGLALLIAVLGAGLLVIQSQYARKKALDRIVASMETFLGRKIAIGSIDYTFFPIGLELHDVVIPGPRPGDPPVLRAPFARVQIAVRDLRGRVFDLEQIEVVKPEIYLQYNPDGTSNLPQFRFQKQAAGPRRFEVRIGRILVQDGVFRLNERKTPLSLEARAIWGRLTGRAERGGEGGNRLDALVTAQEVVTTLPRARPYRFTVSAKGSVLPEQGLVRIAVARLAGPDLQARVNGQVAYRSENRRVELGIDAEGAAQIANRLGYMEQPIAGPATVHARFEWTPAGWSYAGTAGSPRIDTFDRVIQDIQASFTGGPDGLDVDVERARYADGTVGGLIAIDTAGKRVAGVPVALDLEYSELSIRQLLDDQFPGEDLPIVDGLSGRARGTLEYRLNSDAPLLGAGRADVEVRGTSETGLPIAGRLPIFLDGGVISGRNLHLTSPGQDVTSSGFTYDLERGTGRLDFRLVSTDVGPLNPLLRGKTAPGEEPPFWLPTRGRGAAEGTMTFARQQFSLGLRLDLQDVVAPATTADTVHGSLVFNPRAVEDLRMELTRGGGALIVTGRVPLPEAGRAAASQPLDLAVDAAQWPASGLGWFLGPKLAETFQGELSGRVDLAGVPDHLTGRIDAQVRDLVVAGIPVGQARAVADFDGGRIAVEQGQIETPAGMVFAQGSFDPATEALTLNVLASSLALDAEPFRRYLGGDLTGRMTVQATASGTLSEPQATVSILGRDLVLLGRPVVGQGETRVVANWNGRRVDVQGSLLGLASFQGGGRLDRQGAEVALDLRSDQLGTLARVFAPQNLPAFTGSLVGMTALGADFAAGTWSAGVQLADLRLQYEGHTIANREPIMVDVTPERATVQSFYMGEPGTENELVVAGTLGLEPGIPLNLRFQSTLAATWAGLFLPDYRIEGALDLLGAVRGTAGEPLLSGEGEVRGGRVIAPTLPQAVEDINGFLSFNRDRILLDDLHARLGGGTLRANGSLVLPGAGRTFSYRLNVAADNISLRFPEFLNNRGNAEISLISSDGGRQIVGEVNLERSLYVEDVPVDLLQFVQILFQRQRLELVETGDFEATTQLNLVIQGADALRVRNNVANLQGDVNLTVRGTVARPVIFGEVEIVPGGTLVFNDNEYEVQRGVLTFSNPNRIDPFIDLVAQTEIQRFNITLNIGGTLERPDVNFASDANLADLEILTLIATGQQPTEGIVPPSTVDQEVAPSEVARQFLYGQAATALTKRVGSLFGFDRFRIDPITEAGQPISGVGVTVGKRLSRDVFVTYSSNPSTNRQYVVQVEWQVKRNVTLVLTQAGDGTYAVDAQWQRRF